MPSTTTEIIAEIPLLTAAIPFPQIDPILFTLGPLSIRWYALAYLTGALVGWWLMRRIVDANENDPVGRMPVDAVMNAAVIGIILGGRLGYVLLYNFSYYLQNPLEALMVWQGGLSFHGGFLGVVVAIFFTAWRHGCAPFRLGDLIALITPIGIFLGRIANFINAELYGRVTDVPWAVIFPYSDGLPRHPSQIYEALLEGPLLFAILYLVYAKGGRAIPGLITGVFISGYGLARMGVEFFREPDAHIGFILAGVTMGQVLSAPMVMVGVAIIVLAIVMRQRT